jgi:hypothetical protein
MGFFSLLETLFFISLAITFVLIMMLVYHFKGRLVVLENKCNTMFEIMNSMVKEMKNIRDTAEALTATASIASSGYAAASPSSPSMTPFGNMFPPELLQLFGSRQQFPSRDDEDRQNYEDDDDDDDDDEDNQEYKKIVVSDNEMETDDEDDVKIISVDISETNEPEPLADLEDDILDKIDIASPDVSVKEEEEEEAEAEAEESTPDYKKMDVSYLRTMVMTRGLATDTKKLKKPELIRLLEQSTD